MINRLPVFQEAVISIWTDAQPPEQPADAEYAAVLLDKPVSL
jgi:hypothetical protein